MVKFYQSKGIAPEGLAGARIPENSIHEADKPIDFLH